MLSSRAFIKPQASSCGIRASAASYATVRSVRVRKDVDGDEPKVVMEQNDFIMSILRAKPLLRDSKNYLASFGAKPPPFAGPQQPPPTTVQLPAETTTSITQNNLTSSINAISTATATDAVISDILSPPIRRTALVKLQGPFSSRQLSSIAQGMVYLEKLGLVSVIVVDNDHWDIRDPKVRRKANDLVLTVASALEEHGSSTRPILDAIVRLGPKPGESLPQQETDGILEAHTAPEDLIPIRIALQAGQIPILAPFAMDSHSHCVNVSSNHIIGALARGMAELGKSTPTDPYARTSSQAAVEANLRADDIDLTPLRLMIISKEGGIPSYARSGLPHLLINLDSEYSFIRDTFLSKWRSTNPTALTNLGLARTCLNYMPPDASAIMVSHRSRSSLIANLITNRPVKSSSLPHALLKEGHMTPDIPTILRKGLPIRVINSFSEIDQDKLTELLEKSFGRTLDRAAFYTRLSQRLDYVIVTGDYVGAAVVTQEPVPTTPDQFPTSPSTIEKISYLDKFAVLPSHRGAGTVDFLWVALHDESYGLGHPYSVNPNGGKQGLGVGQDLVWRSRANNPINKWYFERCSGHYRIGDWVIFWCDAEMRLKEGLVERSGSQGSQAGGKRRLKLSYLETGEAERIEKWNRTLESIPSVWV